MTPKNSSEGGGSDAKVLFSQLVLDLSVKKAKGQLLGGRYRWDFQVPGGKGRCQEGEGDYFSALLWRNSATI